MLFRTSRWGAISLICAIVFPMPPAQAATCEELWRSRNAIFAEAGHCFKSARAIAVFGQRCHPPYGRLRSADEARVNAIIAEERRLGCSGQEPIGSGAGLPPPDTQQGGPTNGHELNEAASVWAATKDSNSPAVLEAYIARFGSTPFGDLARARLKEVKQVAAERLPKPAGEGQGPPGELCPKYIPSVGRIVQAPCDQ